MIVPSVYRQVDVRHTELLLILNPNIVIVFNKTIGRIWLLYNEYFSQTCITIKELLSSHIEWEE